MQRELPRPRLRREQERALVTAAERARIEEALQDESVRTGRCRGNWE